METMKRVTEGCKPGELVVFTAESKVGRSQLCIGELFSECCGASAGLYEDIGICPECKEHCEWITEGDPEDD